MFNYSGKLIVIDGTDGSGKATQLNFLKTKLESEGYEVMVADFPQYNQKSAGLIEEYLSGKYGQADDVTPYQASIFYAADRYDASTKIREWLKNGKIVLANRYTSANMGHQGGKIENPLERKAFFNWLYELEYKLFNIPQPDLSIILHVEAVISQKLAQKRARTDWVGSEKDIHESNLDHLKKAEKVYLEIAETYPEFQLINCTKNNEIMAREEIALLVWLMVKRIIISSLNESAQFNKTKNFRAIGDIISTNPQIMKNRDLIFEANKATSEEFKPTATKNREEINNPLVNQNIPNEQSVSNEQNIPNGQSFSNGQNVSTEQHISNEQSVSNKNIVSSQPTVEKLLAERLLVEKLLAEKLIVEKLSATAKLPQKAHTEDAGYDLFANDYYSIAPYSQSLVATGIKLAIPQGFVGLIWDKSGLAFQGITTMGGVIDSNYRGEIKIIIKNLSEEIYNIIPGQKIAQILIQAISTLEISEEKITDTTTRAAAGFGSTGKF